MEPLRLKPRQPVEDEEMENWDEDDDFVIDNDDATFIRSASSTNAPPTRRESLSSRTSIRSDLESLQGEDERQVHLPGDDEKSTLEAIAAAAKAGIPIPTNVPSSALTGGTIKRLGGRKIKSIIQDDWEHDLEIPDSNHLTIKAPSQAMFPDVIRQVSGASSRSPSRTLRSPPWMPPGLKPTSARPSILASPLNLDKFRDTDLDDNDCFGDGNDTIKISKKRRTSRSLPIVTPPTPQQTNVDAFGSDDDFENDFELPSDGKLNLTKPRDAPKTPASYAEDLDWSESSLGTRYGGTRRDGRSNRSSSTTALSPSLSSSITMESEDETFDGLVLPSGPLDLKQRLDQRKTSEAPSERLDDEPVIVSKPPDNETDKDDMLDGLDFGEGEIFDGGKLTNHKNLKVKEPRQPSPTRPKTAVSLTFTSKPVTPGQSRLPRYNHERTQSMLEPVLESGGPIAQRSLRRSHSRIGGPHSAQSSVSSMSTSSASTQTSTTQPLPPPPSTPVRRELGAKSSTVSLRAEPTTTNAQLLRLKRSLPAMRAPNSPAKSSASRFERPPSRGGEARHAAAAIGIRPKTPVDRNRPKTDPSSGLARKPFLPAGASTAQSRHLTAKNSRTFRRHDSEHSIDLRPGSRAGSRTTARSPSPRRYRIGEEPWVRLSKPKKKVFGDGHELDGFDDLPTSAQAESKFMKIPLTSGPKFQLRNNKVNQHAPPPNSGSSPTPPSPMKHDSTPRFARDTAASRIARETALAQRAPSHGALTPLIAQRVSQLSTRNPPTPQTPRATIRSRKKPSKTQQKPHLISNLNMTKSPKTINGMSYNPETYQWEGNENALRDFDAPVSTPSTVSIPSNRFRDKETTTPRPALITNRSSTQGVQVVGGMVFDPQNMCWLKIGLQPSSKNDGSDAADGFSLDEEDDVFKDIPDLEDKPTDSRDGSHGRASDIQDEWLVGEEFDVGPEFIKRQRKEEERWMKKVGKWVGRGNRNRDAWRWTIRNLVVRSDDMQL